MLRELRVENVGVIADLSVVLEGGMTALTGETGAGKTLVVEAIELLLGARADVGLVRAGADEARVEARFEIRAPMLETFDDPAVEAEVNTGELILARVVPARGRSRAYINGRMVPAGTLADLGRRLVDLHGQHSHHTLLTASAQRAALDRFGGEATGEALAAYQAARGSVRGIDRDLAALGGDDRERAREADLLRFQVAEIDGAAIESEQEDELLQRDEEVLSSARVIREGAEAARASLDDDVLDMIGAAAGSVHGVPSLEAMEGRLGALQDEAADLARELRHMAERAEDDPARLEAVMSRRRVLRDLRRKYGASLAEVLTFRDDAAARLDAIVSAEGRATALQQEREAAMRVAVATANDLSTARKAAAARLGTAVADELHELGMPAARVEIAVQSVAVDELVPELPEGGVDLVEFLLAANPGEPLQPLSRVASGGELARTMLAARMLLTEGAPTLVFDEVDAGIGGQAGLAVGRRLGLVARQHQVLCVTHLAQVAAFADAQIAVAKDVTPPTTSGKSSTERTAASARVVEGPDRVAELSRMLSGQGTDKALDHAEELLSFATENLAS